MSGKHKNATISFRPSDWQRALIEERAVLSGHHKKDFITRSCIYSNIVVVGKQENIKRIVDSLQEMQYVMREIAGQIESGDFSLSGDSYQELRQDYLALVVTVVDIINGAAYLFDEAPDRDNQHCNRHRGNVRHNTTKGRERLMKLLEADKPGSCPIDSVKLSDAKEWALRMKEKGLSCKTISNDKRSLKAAFYTAIQDDCIRKNPFDFLTENIAKKVNFPVSSDRYLM